MAGGSYDSEGAAGVLLTAVIQRFCGILYTVIRQDISLKIKVSGMKRRSWIVLLAAALLLGGCTNKADKESLEKGEKLVKEEAYEEALAVFQGLESSKADMRRVYRGIGLSYMGMGQYEDAISALERSLKEAGGKISDWEYDTNYYLAIAFEKNGQRQDAIDTWSNLISTKKEAESYFQRGLLYLKNEKKEQVEKDFDAAVAADEGDYQLPIRIYEAVSGNYPELGDKYLRQLTEREAKSGEALYYKGIAYRELGETTAAEDTLKQAVKEGFGEANLVLGEMFNVEGSYDYAIGFYQAYVKENPESERAYEELMAAQMVQKDYPGALETLNKARKLENFSGKELEWYEIICYEYMGDYGTAREKAAIYVEAWPKEERVQREYEFLKTR